MTVATITVASSTGYTALSITETFNSLTQNFDGPQAATNMTVSYTLSIVGSSGTTTLSPSISSLYLLGLVYNCSSSVSFADVVSASVNVQPLLSTGALSLLPLIISEAVRDIRTDQLIGVSLSGYRSATNVSGRCIHVGRVRPVRRAHAVTRPCRSAVDTSASLQPPNSPPTLSHSHCHSTSQLPAQRTGSCWHCCPSPLAVRLCGLLPPRPPSTQPPTWDTTVYGVQDAVQVWPLPAIEPIEDTPVVTVLASTTSLARQLVLLLVDTTGWSSAVQSMCSNTVLTGVTFSANTSTPVPVSVFFTDGSPTFIYGFSQSTVPAMTDLTALSSDLSFVQVVAQQYGNLAWIAYLSQSSDVTAAVSEIRCKPTRSLSSQPPVDSIDGSYLPFVVPYLPLGDSAATAAVTIPVSIVISNTQPCEWQVQLLQVNTNTVFGNTSMALSIVRQPTMYNSTVTMTSLPLVDRTDLYWAYSFLVNGTVTLSGVKAVAAAASADAIDLSTQPTLINLATAAVMQPSTAVTIPVQLTATTAGKRWLVVRLVESSELVVNSTNVFGAYSVLIVGATGERVYSILLPITQPIAAGSSLVLQAFLSTVQSNASAGSGMTVWSDSSLQFSGSLNQSSTDSLDLTVVSFMTTIDCAAPFVTVELNVSTETARTLVVELEDLTDNTATSASQDIPGPTFFQPRRIQVNNTAIGSSCGHFFSIRASLMDGSAVVVSAKGESSMMSQLLLGMTDTVTVLQASTSTNQWAATLNVTTRLAPRLVHTNLINEDGSFSYGPSASNVWPLPAPAINMQWQHSDAAASALLGGARLKLSIILTSTLIPSLATDLTQAWQLLTFESFGGFTGSYGWQQSEPGDASCPMQHTGLVTFNGASQYIDLSATSGPTSSGLALPGLMGGAGSGYIANGTEGWSFEMTFRPGPPVSNGKLFMFGDGGGIVNIWCGWDGSAVGFQIGVYDTSVNYPSNGDSSYQQDFVPEVNNQWYHFVFVMQRLDPAATHGAIFMWVNGQLMQWLSGVTMDNWMVEAPRPVVNIAKSNWDGDPYWSGEMDTFRIFDKALTGLQIQSLYESEMGHCPITVMQIVPPADATPNIVPSSNVNQPTPWYSLTFATDPRPTSGAAGYGWEQVSPTDNSTQRAVHTGILSLNGSLNQFVNMTAASGPFSVGQVLPTFGGGTAGWSFEMTIKPMSDATIETWAKIVDIGAPRVSTSECQYDVILGWDQNDVHWQAAVCDGVGNQYQTSDGFGPIYKGQWYHVVLVVLPAGGGWANYVTYINGQMFTSVNGAPYLPYTPRANAYLGRSGWSDHNFTGEVDTFNIYNVSLSSVQVAGLYFTGFGNTAVPLSTAGTMPAPVMPTTTYLNPYFTSTADLPPYNATAFLGPTVCSPAVACSANPAPVPAAWYNLTFDDTPAKWNVQVVPVAGTVSDTTTDLLDPSSLPSNVDPSVASAPFQLSLTASTNGQRTLRMLLFTNNTGSVLVFASGGAAIYSPIQQQVVTVTLYPLIPVSFGMQHLQLSCALTPLNNVGAAYSHFSTPAFSVSALSAASLGATDSLTITMVNSSAVVDPRTLQLELELSGFISKARDINCSASTVSPAQLTVFTFGSTVVSFPASQTLRAEPFTLTLQHLFYPGLSSVQVGCYVTTQGGLDSTALYFSNTHTFRIAQLTPTYIGLTGLPPSNALASTLTPSTAAVNTSLAYASGLTSVPFQVGTAVVGSGPKSLMMWIPNRWALITLPPPSGLDPSNPAPALSHYISPLAALLEAAEIWVIQQRVSMYAPDAVTLTIQCVDPAALLNTPLCTDPNSGGTALGPSSPTSSALLNCPDLVVINNDEVAARAQRDELVILDFYFSQVQTDTGRQLTDELSRYYVNALQINSHVYGTPLTSDTRLLYYNKTTLASLQLAFPPPLNSQRWGGASQTDYSRSWTWTMYGNYLQTIAQYYGNGTGAVMRGGQYEELILAQMIAQSYNGELLAFQPNSSSYATVPGQGSGLNSPQYELAMTQTFDRWFSHDMSATADTVMSGSTYTQWLAADLTDAEAIALPGTTTLADQVLQRVSSLYIDAVIAGTSWDQALAASADIASYMPLFTGCAIESSSLTAFLSPSSEIAYAIPPGSCSYLGGTSLVISSQSQFIQDAFNLSYILVDDTAPYQTTLSSALHTLPPYSTFWSDFPFDGPDFAVQQIVVSPAKPITFPLDPLAQLPALITNSPLRQLVLNLAVKHEPLDDALTASSMFVSRAFFPLVRVTAVGDSVTQSQTAVFVIIGVLVTVLSSWVASIISEQAIFNHGRGDLRGAAVWLLLTAIAMGGGGMWCALLMQASGIVVNASPDPSITTLPITFAIDLTLACLPLAIIPAWIGLLMMIGSLDKARQAMNAKKAAEAAEGAERSTSTQSGQADPTAMAKKRKAVGAALTWTELSAILWQATDWRCFVAGICVALSLAATRVLVFNIWVVAASYTPSVAATILCFVLDSVLCTVSVLFMFHAVKGRMIGILLLAAAVMLDYQINFYTMSLTYTGVVTAPLTHSVTVSASSLSLLTGLLAAFVCLLFVGLQFQRMKLSRSALARKVAKLQGEIDTQRRRAEVAERSARKRKMEQDILVKMMELINLCRPIAGEPTFLLAFAATAAESRLARAVLDPVPATPSPNSPQPSKVSAATLKQLTAITEEAALVSRSHSQDGLSAQATLDELHRPSIGSSSRVEPERDSSVLRKSSVADNPMMLRQAWSNSAEPSVAPRDSVQYERFERTVLQWVSSLTANGSKSPNPSSRAVTQPDSREPATKTIDFGNPSPFAKAIGRQSAQLMRNTQPSELEEVRANIGRSVMAALAQSSAYRLQDLLAHPVTVEIVKGELERIHSEENLAFYLAATRYQDLKSGPLSKYCAVWLYSTFVAANAPQQINIDTAQRLAIEVAMKKGAHGSAIFDDAKREVLSLMETNLKAFKGSPGYRMCCWVLEATLMAKMQLQLLDTEANRESESNVLGDSPSEFGTVTASSDDKLPGESVVKDDESAGAPDEM